MGGLKDELLKAIWHAFTALDLDRSGKVSKSQLKVSPLPALPVGHGTRRGVRREGWLGMWRGGGPHSSFRPPGGARGAGALLRLPRLPRPLRCAPRGAAGPAERPPATGWMGARDLSLTSGTMSRASPPRRPQTLGLVRARAERPVSCRLPAKAIAFIESSVGFPKTPEYEVRIKGYL